MSEPEPFYVLRYVDGTPITKRWHRFTLGRWATWLAAEDVRLASPVAASLEVCERFEAIL